RGGMAARGAGAARGKNRTHTQSGIESRVERFRAGLRDFGYVEGDNIFIDFRWAEGNYARLAGFAAELVRLKVDLLATYGTPGTLAAKQATTTVPIVMIVSGDAVATGIIASLARPGGNVTGLTFFSPRNSSGVRASNGCSSNLSALAVSTIARRTGAFSGLPGWATRLARQYYRHYLLHRAAATEASRTHARAVP